MLSETRFAKHFEVVGNTDTHFGEFTCEGTIAAGEYTPEQYSSFSSADAAGSSSGSCC